uniref:Uncharacterized protein n=1 Tax=Phocoena sinus TaxID=42100 RepID=A0A8C9CN93_PHOSS
MNSKSQTASSPRPLRGGGTNHSPGRLRPASCVRCPGNGAKTASGTKASESGAQSAPLSLEGVDISPKQDEGVLQLCCGTRSCPGWNLSRLSLMRTHRRHRPFGWPHTSTWPSEAASLLCCR